MLHLSRICYAIFKNKSDQRFDKDRIKYSSTDMRIPIYYAGRDSKTISSNLSYQV